MDQTKLFKATVRTLNLRKKERQGGTVHSGSLQEKTSEFISLARDVVVFISKLQAFLLKHRKNYIDSARHLLGGGSAMTDSERDEIDSEAQKFIERSRDRINALRDHLYDDVSGEQMREYRQAVFESLQDYLKRVAKLYSEQRAIRVKRIVDRKRLSRLQPEHYRRLLGSTNRTNYNLNTDSSRLTIDREPSSHVQQTTLGNCDSRTSGDPCDSGEGEEESVGRLNSLVEESTGIRYRGRGRTRQSELDNGSGLTVGPASHPQPLVMASANQLTEQEENEFAQENEQLLEHVTTMVDEVRQIEGKVIEISKLQELFSQKVLQQAEQLDSIASLTENSAENVIEGNEQIRGAIKNRASLRVWILFTLIVLSFAILFLDWYS